MRTRLRRTVLWTLFAVVGLTAGVAAALAARNLPALRHWLSGGSAEAAAADEHGHDEHATDPAGDHDHGEEPAADEHGHDEHEGDAHKHAEYDHVHDEAAALALSRQAQANIGLKLVTVELRPYERKIAVPAVVVERPGCSQVQITAPLTGLVTKIFCIEGEAVTPGTPLFIVQLTHEELVQAQADFLQNAEQLEVVRSEVQRISKVVAEGAVAGKALLERQYEQRKLEAVLHALRQRLILHGLTPEQVDGILATKTLFRDLTVKVPQHECAAGTDRASAAFKVQKLEVQPGQHVTAGQPLCVLADHAELYVEGRAFEEDIPALNRAAAEGSDVTAVFQSGAAESKVESLKVLYLSDTVDLQSRAFSCYVALPNRLIRDTGQGHRPRFIDWQFKPGQRARLMVPVERWKGRIVLPLAAVAQDGAEAYVFEHNTDHFDRRPVHVEYRDQDWVVIANDGTLRIGSMVAGSAAHQMQLAIKNKAGAGVDPHAGHNH